MKLFENIIENKVTLYSSFAMVLLVGFCFGVFLGVEIITIEVDTIPKMTISDLIVFVSTVLGAISAFIATVLAIVAFSQWRKQQRDFFLMEIKRDLIRKLNELGSSIRLYVSLSSQNDSKAEIHFEKMYLELIESHRLVTQYYSLSTIDRGGKPIIEYTVKKQSDFLDSAKQVIGIANELCNLKKIGFIEITSQRVKYHITDGSYQNTDDFLSKYKARSTSDFKYLTFISFIVALDDEIESAIDSIRYKLS